MSGFKADSGELTSAAKHLDNLAEELGATRQEIRSTMVHDKAFSPGSASGVFQPDGISDRGGLIDSVGPVEAGRLFEGVGQRWDEARHFLSRAFDDNIENLRLSAVALAEIAERYRESDRSGADGMPSS